MKLRIVQHQRVRDDGSVVTWFTVQEREWFFWHTHGTTFGMWDGPVWQVTAYNKYEEAEAHIVRRCDMERARRKAAAQIKHKTVLAEVDCGK